VREASLRERNVQERAGLWRDCTALPIKFKQYTVRYKKKFEKSPERGILIS